MNKKVISAVGLAMLVIVGLAVWQGYGKLSSKAAIQSASIYDATGEPLDQRVASSDALAWQPVGNNQCLGLNDKGQAVIGKVYRKSLSFDRDCKIIHREVDVTMGYNTLNSKRIWFGSLVGSQCYSVTIDDFGNAAQVFLEQDIKDKNSCLIN